MQPNYRDVERPFGRPGTGCDRSLSGLAPSLSPSVGFPSNNHMTPGYLARPGIYNANAAVDAWGKTLVWMNKYPA
ncbi:MAG: hypothetical protein M1482_04690 [Chloroflexi bacterium]|nr:hypothetical protein [Chloroflexota bacterium]